MTPDVYTDLTIVNATSKTLIATAGSSYQMASWMPTSYGTTICNSMKGSNPYRLQFLRGVGDEDDSADEFMGLSSPAQPISQGMPAIHLYAGSDDHSGHYLTYEFLQLFPKEAPYTVGACLINTDVPWYNLTPDQLDWKIVCPQSSPVYPNNTTSVLILADLSAIGIKNYSKIYVDVLTGNVSAQDQDAIFSAIKKSVVNS